MNASTILSRSLSNISNHGDNVSDLFNPVTEVHYEQKAVSEAIRLSKHSKILKFCANPTTETNLAVLWVHFHYFFGRPDD